jgi:hypothetical protein
MIHQRPFLSHAGRPILNLLLLAAKSFGKGFDNQRRAWLLPGFGILPEKINENDGNLSSSQVVAGAAERPHNIEMGACRCQTEQHLSDLSGAMHFS